MYKIITIAKMTSGAAWFNRMNEGCQRFERENGHSISLVGLPKADLDLQIQLIEDAIAQGVDALCIEPIFPQALEMIFCKVRRQGMVVITHGASQQFNVDYDIEAFDNAAYGAHLMDHLAQYMGEEGHYAVFGGNLMSLSHTEWVRSAIARQEGNYPRMRLANGRIQDHENQAVAYKKTRELLKDFPNLKGIQGSAMRTIAGVAQAVEEVGLQGKVTLVGTSLVSTCWQYLANETIKLISFWDPADMGYVMNTLAARVLKGDRIAAGMDLGAPGYNHIGLDGKVMYGSAWIDVTKANMAHYNF